MNCPFSGTPLAYKKANEDLKKKEETMFTALFILCVVIFGYLMYVLIKPEKF